MGGTSVLPNCRKTHPTIIRIHVVPRLKRSRASWPPWPGHSLPRSKDCRKTHPEMTALSWTEQRLGFPVRFGRGADGMDTDNYRVHDDIVVCLPAVFLSQPLNYSWVAWTGTRSQSVCPGVLAKKSFEYYAYFLASSKSRVSDISSF